MIATSNFVTTNQVVHNGTTVDNINNNNNGNQDGGGDITAGVDTISPAAVTKQMVFNGGVGQTNDVSNHDDENDVHSLIINEDNNDKEIKTEAVDADELVVDGQSHQESNTEESVDITISNVVSNFSVRCHLNLRQIACNGSNVVYKREQSIILMKLRQPNVTASIWSSGKITCTGATTEESAKCASRRIARCLQKLGFRVRFSGYRIVNVLGACRLPFGIKIHEFSDVHRPLASYEPELHPGATYRIKELKAVLKVFQTGSITITAPSIRNVQLAVEHIYPLVYEFRKPKPGSIHHQPLPMEEEMEIFGADEDNDSDD